MAPHQQEQREPRERVDGRRRRRVPARDWSFYRRVAVAGCIVAGIAAAALFLWYAMYVLLLGFAAVLVAVMLRGLADWLTARTGIPGRWSLWVVLLVLAVAGAGFGWFAATRLSRRVSELAERLPQTIRSAEDRLRHYAWGRLILSAADGTGGGSGGGASTAAVTPAPPGGGPGDDAGRGEAAQAEAQMLGEPAAPTTQPATNPTTQPLTRPSALVKAVSAATAGPGGATGVGGWFNRALQGLIGVVVVLAAGIYLAASPRLYTNGLLHLVPKPHRAAAADLLCKIAYVLRHWMLGQLVPMAAIGTLTAIGLKLIGIEMWLIIGLLAALFNFIPNFGPLVSFVPAFLLALAADPSKALWVVVLWVVAQSLEGYVLTPLVQRRAVELPPALTILVQVLMGLLLGTLGIILAAPLAAAGMVAVQTLWVREALGDPVRTPDEQAAAAENGGTGERGNG